MLPLAFDLFCRVIDNFGDVGVAWRLAAALGERGHRVRLWTDDASALAWMAPAGAPGVQVLPWAAAETASPAADPPGDVVIETFGCALPPAFVARMARRPVAPVWINLEYLSAEPYAQRCHGLPSPQASGPGAGLRKWFYYPGFVVGTGGLLQGGPLLAAGDARAWADAQGWGTRPGERAVLLFAYPGVDLPALLQSLAGLPTLLRLPPGGLCDRLHGAALPAGLRSVALPHLPQPDFDRLLAASDLNIVRGEDSFVRAQLASDAPFLWHIYPQHDGAHGPKLQAFLDGYLAGAAPGLAGGVRRAFAALNGLAPGPLVLPDAGAWATLHQAWRARLHDQDDLATQLLRFVNSR